MDPELGAASAEQRRQQLTPAKYGERILTTCGYLLVGASMFSFVGIAALKVWDAFHQQTQVKFDRWLDFVVSQNGTITLLLVGVVTATLGKRLLTTVRLADARTIPVEDLPLIQQAVIDGKPEPVDQYVRLRSLTGWAGNFTKKCFAHQKINNSTRYTRICEHKAVLRWHRFIVLTMMLSERVPSNTSLFLQR